ncbi:hypothetical protein H2202_000934 [Exophiala xenobiotica]|nr:hypothetical protein H2202_000934 [Exophiala xenobiotica]
MRAPPVPKLRSSCDGCGTAKVKCDRGQPGCARCVALGLTCVYGRSRKFGKPARKRPGAWFDANTSLSCGKRTTWTTESSDNHITMGFERPQTTGISEPAQLNFSDMLTDILPMPSGIDTTTMNIDGQNQAGSALFLPLSFDEWPQLDTFGTGPEIPYVPKPSAPDVQLSTSVFQPPVSFNTTSTSSNSHKSHSCPRESYEILADLICPSPSLHAPAANANPVSAQFDHVLHFNRNAIDRLSRLLKCPCAISGHRVMVHASIISRVLIWYQQAAGWSSNSTRSTWTSTSASAGSSTSRNTSPSSPLPAMAATDTRAATLPTLTQSTGFAVAQVPVTVGTFSVEDQNLQAAFRDQFVLSELKKAASLIDLFSSQDSAESGLSGVASLCSYLGAWLRSEHSKIVRILSSRVESALDEDLGS